MLTAKLLSLHARLSDAQRALLQAADWGVLPASGALAQIADLERAMAGLDAAIDQMEAVAGPKSNSTASAHEQSSTRHSGTVKWFDTTKGFGFIVSDQGGDVFVHGSEIVAAGLDELRQDERISFEIKPDPIKGRPVAAELRLL